MTSGDGERERNFEGAGAALEFAIWGLSDQVRTIERTDAKSERAMTLAVAIFALFSGALTFQLDSPGRLATVVASVAAIAVAGCFVLAVWLFFRSYAAINWHLGPESERLLEISGEHAESRVRQWLAEQILASVAHNETSLKDKTVWSTRLFRAVLLEAAFAGAGVVALLLIASAAN